MGDVCGKGTEAAKVTALARYTLRAAAGEHLSPAAVLDRLNTAMRAQHAPRHLTAVQATFRTTVAGLSGRLCLAGHPPALIRRANGRVERKGVFGTLLGVFDSVRLIDVRFRLAPGDLLLLYTDGACEGRPDPESPRPSQPIFDEAALARTLAGSHGLDAAATTGHVAAVLAAHHGGWASDDTALLALRVPPRPDDHAARDAGVVSGPWQSVPAGSGRVGSPVRPGRAPMTRSGGTVVNADECDSRVMRSLD